MPEEQYYVWYHFYVYDEEDKYFSVSEEMFNRLKPMRDALASGSWPPGFDELYGEIEGISKPLDLKPSEVDTLPWANVIEVAIC